jgi:hypothetical protein
MMRITLVAAVCVATWSASERSASAQVSRNPAAAIFRRHTIGSPSVSPYLNLLNNNSSGTATPYQSLVRPQLEQQRVNQQQSRSIQGLQQNLQAQARANAGGAGIERGTGHPSVFMDYLHYYPGLNQR